jgi:hypothetical protein
MATSEILGLFTTPEQYQLAQQQAQQAQAIQYANLDPMARANYGTFRAGQQLGGAIGGALGGEDPQLKMISISNQIARSANLADPDSLESSADQLAKIGNIPLAVSFSDRAKVLREEKRKGAESEALIGLRGAQAEKAKKYEQQIQVSKENRDIIARIEEKLATDPTYDINDKQNAKEIAQARMILGQEMKTRTITDRDTGALLGTIEGLDINFSAPNLARLLTKQQAVKTEGEVTSPAVGTTTSTDTGLKVTETPSSLLKKKEEADKEIAKVEELKRESEGFQEGLSAIRVLRGTIAGTAKIIGPTTTGWGALLAVLPESDAMTLSDNTQTIKDNIALTKLKELKQQSKTGASGLGALNMKEFDAIQGIIARLNPKSKNYANDLKTIDDFFARAEKLMSEQGTRVEERVANRPTTTKTPVPSGAGDKEARIKAAVDRAMADPRTKGTRAQVEAYVRSKMQ